VKGLTLLEPWGYAHVHLGKRIENRTWRIPKERYALHSGKGVDKQGTEYIESLGYRIDWSKVTPGAVIAVCDIVRLVEIDQKMILTNVQQELLFEAAELCGTPELKEMATVEIGQPLALTEISPDQRKWAFGPWAHVYDVETFRVLPKPVPCKGALGLWDLPGPVWMGVLEQLRAMPPKVLNIRIHGKPQNSVFVGRPSKWGNPFTWKPETLAEYVVPKDEVISAYESWLKKQKRLLKEAKIELRGRDLVCFCKPSPCHADILIREVNS
jgi:hypothetical protein